ncbi:hypothetical protein FQN60_004439 [Etheostoma spectabile]|uniref:Uncharacterized protein n=1 Tax=Etheostoma spectabile TaxID=54343 RepID=A0A5J5CZM5_9PERO|nr:hypothetical protein FQN60_004439 [Etheostoma spectabile]
MSMTQALNSLFCFSCSFSLSSNLLRLISCIVLCSGCFPMSNGKFCIYQVMALHLITYV